MKQVFHQLRLDCTFPYVYWNSLLRKIFHLHRWQSVRLLVFGLERLGLLHIPQVYRGKFYRILSVVKVHLCRAYFISITMILLHFS